MRIVVLLKSARSEPQTAPSTTALDASARSALAQALALAVLLREQSNSEETSVTALCAGPPAEQPILELALRAGVDRAVRLWCDTEEAEAVVSRNVRAVGELLAAGVRHLGYDLILAGSRSPGWASGIVGQSVAFELDVPHVTEVVELAPAGSAGSEDSLRAVQHRGALHAELLVGLPTLLTIRAAPPLCPMSQSTRRGDGRVEVLGCNAVGFEPEDPLPWPTLPTVRVDRKRARLADDSRELLERLQALGLLPATRGEPPPDAAE